VVKANYDDLIITVGALVLGLGLLQFIQGQSRLATQTRSYAVTPIPVPPIRGTPCAAACAPFKSSPATYATCCKQHGANAPKPVAKPKIGSKTYPLTYKPVSSNELMDDSFRTLRNAVRDPPNVTNNTYNNFTAPPVTTGAPSGGGSDESSNGRCTISHHTSGCNGPSECDRLQIGKYNSSDSSDLRIRFTVQDGQGPDSLTSQVGGEQHCKTCDWKGYKTYISVNGGKFGAGIEDSGPGGGDKGKPFYGPFGSQEGFMRQYNMITGHTYDVRTTKQNGTKNGKPAVHLVTTITEVGGQPVTVVDVWDMGRLQHGSPFIKRQGVQGQYIDQFRIDNYPKEKGCAAVVSFG